LVDRLATKPVVLNESIAFVRSHAVKPQVEVT